MIRRVACIAALCAASSVAAQSQPDVPLLVVGDAPADFDLARLQTALETYVVGARLIPLPIGSVDDPGACAQALERAGAQRSPIAVWARWTGSSLALSIVRVARGCDATESTVVDVEPDQRQFIYRVAALKIASMVRETIGSLPPAEPPKPVVPVVARPVIPIEEPWTRLVELGASGDASAAASERRYYAVATVRVGKHGWNVGPMVQASAPQSGDVPGGSGRAFQLAALAAVGRTLIGGTRWSLDADASLGVAYVWSTGQRDGGPAMTAGIWVPIASLAPRLRFDVSAAFAITAGPGVDLAMRTVRLTLGDIPLYEAGHVQWRWDLRAQLRF